MSNNPNDPKTSRAYLWNRMDKIPAETLQEAYKDLARRAALSGEEHSQVFEVDGEEVILPTRAMHDFIQEKEARKRKMEAVGQERRFSKVRETLGVKPESEADDNLDDKDNGYYWDTNYNYEYMNPESEKKQVLGKVKP